MICWSPEICLNIFPQQHYNSQVCGLPWLYTALEIRISFRPRANPIPTTVAARLIPHVRYVART